MYRVAVVDDDEFASASVVDMINAYAASEGRKVEISRFYSGDEFLREDSRRFDLIFLDVEMPGRNGLETAKEVRKVNDSVIIIFFTNLVQYAIHGYEVDALAYLVKPIQQYPFNLSMGKAFKLLTNRQTLKIAIKTVQGQIYVHAKEIVYIEVQRHNLLYYVKRDDGLEMLRARGSMSEVCEKLAKANFARCSTSYLVNLTHVISVKNNKVMLPKTELPLSRTCKKSFSETFMKYLLTNEVESI